MNNSLSGAWNAAAVVRPQTGREVRRCVRGVCGLCLMTNVNPPSLVGASNANCAENVDSLTCDKLDPSCAG